ncbi:MAG: hypothetical protein WAQ28_03425 [Bacteroidia bacterium]
MSNQVNTCRQCGELSEEKFCSEWCSDEYYFINRTCDGCGGEFWNGGTSCTCEVTVNNKPVNPDNYARPLKHFEDDGAYAD